MLGNERVICVIPARLNSQRFPRKVLAPLRQKPLIQWVYEAACEVNFFDEVVIAGDSDEVQDVVEAFGATYFPTSETCASGTDRLAELRDQEVLKGDIWVNWQADEPFLNQHVIENLLRDRSSGEIWTLQKKLDDPQKIASSNIVKVVTDSNGRALYFSRSCVPFGASRVYQHVGLYAFSDGALKKIRTLTPCPLELEEKLEQLRFLYHGMHIQVHETHQEIFGIDTKEQLAEAEQLSFV